MLQMLEVNMYTAFILCLLLTSISFNLNYGIYF